MKTRKTTEACVWATALLCAQAVMAVQVLYTAEGDSAGATDRMTGNGAQNGVFVHTFSNNTKSATADVFVDTTAKFGSSAFRFLKTPDYLNSIDMQGVSGLGSAFTLAAFVRPDVTPWVQRLFSTWNGTGSVANQLLCDYGSGVSGLRLCINNVIVTASPPATVAANVYSHLAATYDDGAVKLYLNGREVGRGVAGSGTPVIDNYDGRHLQVGQDWRWSPTGMNALQSVGAMDDVLVYDRALASNEIARLVITGAAEFFQQDGILYSAEGDTTNATDKLAPSLAQDGVFGTAGVTVSAANPKFGDRAFNLTNPDGTDVQRDVIQLPHSKYLGERFTLALHLDVASNVIQRLLTNWAGTGGIGADQLLFDLVPVGTYTFDMRFFCNGVATAEGVKGRVSFADRGYHHLAATYDNGEIRLYQDGVQVGIGTNGSGAVTLSKDLQLGAGVIPISGSTAQLLGDVDDLLFYTNALALGAIRQLAQTNAEAVISGTLPRPGVLYTAERDATFAADRLSSDGVQNGVFESAGVTVSAGNPKFGRSAFNFADVDSSGGSAVRDVLSLPGTKSLGKRFTLAAYVDTSSAIQQRLFSVYPGTTAGAMLFDFDRDGTPGYTLRFYCGGQTTKANAPFNDGAYHHLAATYDNGEVRLYLDGTQVGIGTNGVGALTLDSDLRMGEDVSGTGNEQLLGDVDDVVVLFEALGPEEVAALTTLGAQQFLDPLPAPPKGTFITLR